MCDKRCPHEFHILSANDEPTHIVTFEDNLQKPILICDSCTTFYDEYKVRQMLGISMAITINEYVESRIFG